MRKLITSLTAILLFSLTGFAASSISGTLGSCVGSTSRLFDSSRFGSGTWSSSNASIATVNSSTGDVYGVASGTCIISYTVGSTVDTATFRVSPRPAGITGVPSSLCVGSSATLACATSGGTWSSGSSVATISSSSGVVRGVSPGTAYIYYSVGVGCSADTTLTITGSYIDSIIGASSVCVGSSTTYRMSSATGGTWSSSNPSIASISATGTLTGVSSGTVTISYSVSTACGTAVSTMSVSVITSISAASLSGPATLSAGSSAYMSASAAGGTWASSNPSVASIDASTGAVTGVSAGSITLTYTLVGCSSTAVSFHSLTVTAFSGISGYVHFNAGRHFGNVKVWLITLTRSSGMLQAIDSTTVYSTGDSVYYEFTTAATDSYRVKAHAIDTSMMSSGYMPTYHDTSFYWYAARVIPHTSGTGDTRRDIHMNYGATVSGPGFIGGSITSGANKGTAGGVPVAGMRVILINEVSNTLIGSTVTDASGNYSFSGLPVGQTYTVFPEAMSYMTTVMRGIRLTSSASSMSAASFLQGTISKTIKPINVSVAQVDRNAAIMNVFPNPASSNLNIQWTVSRQESVTVTLSDMAGRAVASSELMLTEGNGNNSIDVSRIASGFYILSVHSADFSYVAKLEIAH
jgi:uncharacterized protein YjdB